MRVAVISDIHANLPALEAVLASCDEPASTSLVPGRRGRLRRRAGRVRRARSASAATSAWSATTTWRCSASSTSRSFSRRGRGGRRVDRENGSRRDARVPARLKPAEGEREVGLFHASPRDPVWEYVLSIEQAEDCMELQPERIGLIGHSHVALFFVPPRATSARGAARGAQAGEGAELELGARWLLNPGSVGQPRDGDPRAAWLELDTDELDGAASTASRTTSTRPPSRSSPPAFRATSRSGSMSASDRCALTSQRADAQSSFSRLAAMPRLTQRCSP